MYGMVNKALEEFLTTTYSREKWLQVKNKAGVAVPSFILMEQYDDSITYDLVGAASEILKSPAEQILRDFGRSWMTFASHCGYSALISSTATNLTDFLGNLDAIHSQLATGFPKCSPPAFKCTDIKTHELVLHYYSKRPGLTHFVSGLLEGVGDHFGQQVQVKILKEKSSGHDHDEFLVTFNDK